MEEELLAKLEQFLPSVAKKAPYLLLRATSHHLAKGDTDTLNDGQQHSAANGAIARRLVATAHGQRAARQETGRNGIPGILLLADALDRAVECAEETTPDTKVAAEYGRAHLDGRQRADSSFAIRTVAETLDAVPNGTTDGLL